MTSQAATSTSAAGPSSISSHSYANLALVSAVRPSGIFRSRRNSVITINDDDDVVDENNIASSIVLAHPTPSPERPDYVAKANSTSFILNDKLESDAFTAATRDFKF